MKIKKVFYSSLFCVFTVSAQASVHIESPSQIYDISPYQVTSGNHYDETEKQIRKKVFEDTTLATKYGFRKSKNGPHVKMHEPRSVVYLDQTNHVNNNKNSRGFIETKDWRQFTNEYNFVNSEEFLGNSSYVTEIEVTGEDTIVAGLRLKQEGFNPGCLNMANGSTVGGGCTRGAVAQEESIMYRTNYYGSLNKIYETHKATRNVPYNYIPELGVIYTPDVSVFRKTEAERFEFMDQPIHLSFVASDAYNLNKNSGSGKFQMRSLGIDFTHDDYNSYENLKNNKKYITGMRSKIFMQLLAFYENGHDAIVLSGFGCGAFKNNWRLVSELYHSLLENEFKGCFKRVVFGIANPQSNCEKFLDTHNLTSSYLTLLSTHTWIGNQRMKISETPPHVLSEEKSTKSKEGKAQKISGDGFWFGDEWIQSEAKKTDDGYYFGGEWM